MARYKRYFPVSHQFNHDPDIIELKQKFGLSGVCLWLEFLSLADQKENRVTVNDYWLANVSKLVSCRFLTGLEILNWIVRKGWLTPNKPFTKGLEMVYGASNYAEYHRSYSRNSENSPAKSENIGVPPNLTIPHLTKEKESIKKKKAASGSVRGFFEAAERIIDFINNKGNKGYQAWLYPKDQPRKPSASLELIAHRLRDGYTEANLRGIAAKKYSDWQHDPERMLYFRPETLYGKKKCEQYFGEIPRNQEASCDENDSVPAMQ